MRTRRSSSVTFSTSGISSFASRAPRDRSAPHCVAGSSHERWELALPAQDLGEDGSPATSKILRPKFLQLQGHDGKRALAAPRSKRAWRGVADIPDETQPGALG